MDLGDFHYPIYRSNKHHSDVTIDGTSIQGHISIVKSPDIDYLWSYQRYRERIDENLKHQEDNMTKEHERHVLSHFFCFTSSIFLHLRWNHLKTGGSSFPSLASLVSKLVKVFLIFSLGPWSLWLLVIVIVIHSKVLVLHLRKPLRLSFGVRNFVILVWHFQCIFNLFG